MSPTNITHIIKTKNCKLKLLYIEFSCPSIVLSKGTSNIVFAILKLGYILLNCFFTLSAIPNKVAKIRYSSQILTSVCIFSSILE